MATITTAIARMFLVTCVLYHVTLVTGIEDYISNRDITPAAKKCFKEEVWPCGLPLTNFPWNHSRFDAYLSDSKMPALFPDDQKRDYKAFLAILKKAKIYSLLGSCMGYGHRVPLLREMFGYFFGSFEKPGSDPDVLVTETKFNSIPVKLYQPKAQHKGLRPAIFFIHGGGWTLGSADEMDGITRRMATRGDFVVASVNYRLAPEHLFPKGLDDCVNAIKHFLRNAASLGVDKTRVAVSGDSSGGNLAAAVALRLRNDKTKPKLKMQALIYPVLQAFDFNTPSYQKNACDPYLDRSWMISFWMWYANGNMPTSLLPLLSSNAHTTAAAKRTYDKYVDRSLLSAAVQAQYDSSSVVVNGNATLWNTLKQIVTDPYFSPLLAKSMAGLPPTYMFSCEQDVLRDEAFMYVARLRAAGVKVKHAHYQALHALVDNLSVQYASNAVNVMIDYLKTHV